MADSPGSPGSFEYAWGPAGRTLAVVAAALVALAGVLAHVPVWLASLRGLGVLVLVLVIVRIAAFVADALPRTGTGTPHGSAAKGTERENG